MSTSDYIRWFDYKKKLRFDISDMFLNFITNIACVITTLSVYTPSLHAITICVIYLHNWFIYSLHCERGPIEQNSKNNKISRHSGTISLYSLVDVCALFLAKWWFPKVQTWRNGDKNLQRTTCLVHVLTQIDTEKCGLVVVVG